jgi:hypothetical protein
MPTAPHCSSRRLTRPQNPHHPYAPSSHHSSNPVLPFLKPNPSSSPVHVTRPDTSPTQTILSSKPLRFLSIIPQISLQDMPPTQSFSSLEIDTDIESDTTPRASRCSPHESDAEPSIKSSNISPRTDPYIYHSLTVPHTRPPRTDDAPMMYYDDDFEEQEQRWRDSRPLLGHMPPGRDEESGMRTPIRPVFRRRRRCWWEDINFDDWIGYISIWLLFCMVVMSLAGAVAIAWMLVVQ